MDYSFDGRRTPAERGARCAVTALLTGSFLVASTPLFAQEAEAEAKAGAEAAVSTQADDATPATDDAPSALETKPTGPKLDEIIVTAQNRAQDVQDVPISVTAIGGETLDLKGIEGVGGMALVAPNVKIDAGAFFNFIYVRGIGSDNNQGFDSSVGLFIDGVHLGRRGYIDQDFVDVNRVELLRGPQGALFGKNTIAGALAIYTNDPTDEFEFNATYKLGFENFADEDERYNFAVNIPIYKDKVAIRAGYGHHNQPGFMYNTKLDQPEPVTNDDFYHTKARFELADNLTLTIGYDWSSIDLGGSGAQLTELPAHWAALFQLFDSEVEGDGTNTTTSRDARDGAFRDTTLAHARIDWIYKDYTFTSITGYADLEEFGFLDVDFSPVPLLALSSSEEYDQISQEFRVLTPEGPLQFMGGLFYFQSEFTSEQKVPFFGMNNVVQTATTLGVIPAVIQGALDPLVSQLPGIDFSSGADERQNFINQRTTTYSAFGEVNGWLTEEWLLTVGLRYTREKKEAYQRLTHENGGVFFAAIVPGEEDYELDDDRHETHWTPRVVLSWQPDDDQMVYASANQGNKAGGFNANALNDQQTRFEDETSYAFELGYRSTWLGGAALFNVSAFYSIFKDLQVSAFNGTEYVVTNAADAISRGIELEGALALSETLMLTMNYGYLDAYYDSFTSGPCVAGAEETPCDLTGKPLANAPQDSGNFSVFYDTPLFNWPVNFHLSADAFYQGDIFFQTDLDPLDTREAAVLYNARVGFHDPENLWSVILAVNNLTGDEASVGSADVPVFEGAHFGGGGGGRVFYLEGRVRF